MLSPRGFVFPHIPTHLPPFLRSPRNILALGFSIAVATGLTSYYLTRTRLTAEEIERARRDHLASTGRITDGSITETQWLVPGASPTLQADTTDSTEPGPALAATVESGSVATAVLDTPCILIYRYVIAGVTYECAQDVSRLAEFVRHVRVDLPIQVRFDPRNPGNSIVVAEGWSGLRLDPSAHR